MPIPGIQPTHHHKTAKKSFAENEPSSTNHKRRKRHKWFWKKRLLILFIVLTFLGIGSVGAVFAWYAQDLPDPGKINDRKLAESTRIYDRTGEILLYEVHGEQRRTVVPLTDIPKYLRDATIVTEDRGFYSHPGFDIKGIVRAMVKNVLKHDITGEGGSTITQQFIKNAVLTSDKKFDRKIKELVLAYQLEQKFSKDQILELYLNEIPYGSNAYGVESASNFYFGKSAKDLSLAEAATLAALPQRPSYYSPYGSHTDELFDRQKYILDSMADGNYVTKEEAEAAKRQEVKFSRRVENIKAPHFVFYVRDYLEQKYPTQMVEQGGLKVITTLDFDKQTKAEEAIKNGIAKVEQYGGTNAALVSLDTKSGQILAMVGSRDYFDSEHDGQVNVVLSKRQPGSSIKPLIYASAFEKGYTPQTILFDLERDFPIESGVYHPKNYNLHENGPVEMQKALAGSLNVPAVMTLYLTGIDRVVDNAKKLGYSTFSDTKEYGLSMALGSVDVTLLDHASVFATFAREGERHEPTPILKVEDGHGKTIEEFKDNPKRVFDEMSLRRLNKVLSTDALRAFIFGSRTKLTLPDRPVAAKTGTTNDFRDAWTMGYTPSLATGVWVGKNDHTQMKNGADGSVVAAPIWNDYMQKALSGTSVEQFKDPDAPKTAGKGILQGQVDEKVKKKVDKYTGKLIPDECVEKYPADYIEEREFKEVHTILYYVDKDKPLGEKPKDPKKEKYFQIWEDTVQRWAEKQGAGYITKEPDYESCDLRDAKNAPSVSVSSPASGAEVTKASFSVKTSVSAATGRTIQKVEYYIDATKVDTQTTSPYQTSYKAANLTSGKHTLRVLVTDSVQSTAEASVDFTFTADGLSAKEVYFTDPAGSVVWRGFDFPKNIALHVGSPTQVKSIKFYYYDTAATNPEHILITTLTSGITASVSVTWQTAPQTGKYALYAKVTTKDDKVVRSENVVVEVRNILSVIDPVGGGETNDNPVDPLVPVQVPVTDSGVSANILGRR